jgi:hypothetical protein
MPTPQTTTDQLITVSTDLTRFVDDLRRRGVIDLAVYRRLSDGQRRIGRLACRIDAQRRAAKGLLDSGRVPRDVAATLTETAGDDDPLAA